LLSNVKNFRRVNCRLRRKKRTRSSAPFKPLRIKLSPSSGYNHKGELKDGEDEPSHLGSLGGYILGEYTLTEKTEGRNALMFLREHQETKRGVYSKKNILLRGKKRRVERFGKD
jgi:hypothetical protein